MAVLLVVFVLLVNVYNTLSVNVYGITALAVLGSDAAGRHGVKW